MDPKDNDDSRQSDSNEFKGNVNHAFREDNNSQIDSPEIIFSASSNPKRESLVSKRSTTPPLLTLSSLEQYTPPPSPPSTAPSSRAASPQVSPSDSPPDSPPYTLPLEVPETPTTKVAKMVSPLEEKDQNIPIIEKNKEPKKTGLWRDLLAYWLLGLCNNFGYVIMLSAAHDIIKDFDPAGKESKVLASESGRLCHIASTGTILIADIVPALVIKLTAPWMPFWVNTRIFLAIISSSAGFLFVGFADSQWMALLGVVLTSTSSGLGETTFLAYSSKFNKNVISTWSSGTGGAGILGSVSYAFLKELKMNNLTIMLIMLIFPLLEVVAFWIILRTPDLLPTYNYESDNQENSAYDDNIPSSSSEYLTDVKPLLTFQEKFKFMGSLSKYFIPLVGVYFAEYLINQGLFELVYFENIVLDKDSQYRWLNVDYQIGVFISRSTVNLLSIKKIWILTILQFINVAYFLVEVIYYVTPSIWIVFVIVFWEGLLGGGGYVNTFYRMSKEIPQVRREFAMGVVVVADSFGIALAGFSAIPIHNLICTLMKPDRSVVW